MASEYLKWKYRNVTPDAPPPPLSGREKALNWLHYHRLHLLAAGVLLLVVGTMLWRILGIGQVKPDYVFAYIGRNELSEAAVEKLTAALSSLGKDVNGDGWVKVRLNQYPSVQSRDGETTLYYAYAADTRLVADITAQDSYFFLMEDPARVQRAYQILADRNGAPPADGDYGAEGRAFLWVDCPALAALNVPEASGLYLGKRCFYEEKDAEKQAGNEAFWQVLTEGVEG